MITVHYLYEGLPLCRFNTKKPADWPDGHIFTHVPKFGSKHPHIPKKYQMCRACQDKARELNP